MKIVTKVVLLVCTALTALAFASCEVIASTAGQDISGAAETVWLSLTPTKPDFGDDGTGTAKLTLVFNKAIAGLTGDLDEVALANFFTFECDYPADFSKELKAEKISESAGVDAAVYTLTVGNIPATGGIARVTINKTGITPPSRAWSLNGERIPDEAGAALLDFRFVVSAKNPSLGAEVIGSIDHVNKKIVLTTPEGTDIGALTPSVTVNPGCTVTPEGVQDFGNPLIYTVTADKTGAFRDYEVTVHVRTSSSASIEMFQFLAANNAANLTEDVSGIITGSSITVAVPYGTTLGALVPTITYVGATISPANLTSQNFSSPVQWTVTATDGTTQADYWVTVTLVEPVYGIALSGGGSDPLGGDYSFGEAITGYTTRPAALTVTVRNTGNAETGALSVGITGTSYDLSSDTIASIGTALGSNSATFTVQPKTGLGPAVGAPSQNYSATITVSGSDIAEEKTFTVSFTVNDWISAPSIALTPGHNQLGYTITASDPEADSYDVYWVAGNETAAATVKANAPGISGATSLTGTIPNLSIDTLYSVIVVAHKAGLTDCDSLIVSRTTYSVYAIGESGPAGGWIFYDKGAFSDGWRYLEAAPEDCANAAWGVQYEDVPGLATAIGTGKANTQILVEKYPGENYAANLCVAYEANDFDDWFLPSKDELNLMYTNLKTQSLGDFSNFYYWSSCQHNSGQAECQRFRDGDQDNDAKNTTIRSVRAIRAF